MPAPFEPVIVPVDSDRIDAGLREARSKRAAIAIPSVSEDAKTPSPSEDKLADRPVENRP